MYWKGRTSVRQGEGDVRWIYKSKAEYMESLGIGIDSNVYNRHKEEMDRLVEVRIYGERYWIDKVWCASFIINQK